MQETVSNTSKSSLSPAKARLVELMQGINFGSVQGLHVRNGEPFFAPPPRVIREVKFGGENGPRPELSKSDFALKVQVREMFAQMEAMGDGLIVSIEIQRGLPFRMTIAEEVRA